MTPAPLPAGALGLVATLPGIDPALVWADATAWRDFRRPGDAVPATVAVAAVRAPSTTFGQLQALGLDVPDAHLLADARHFGATLPTAMLATLCAGPALARIELAMPVIPQRPRPLASPPAVAPAGRAGALSASEVLLGVIDHGCPFAHQLLRDATGTGTRVLRIWDQDERSPAFAAAGGVTPAAMGYGVEMARPALNALMTAAAQAGLDGAVDEDRCYRLAGNAASLQERFGHGAGVTTLLAGSRHAGEVQPRSDRAAAADIAFVQVPRDALQDSSSGALSRYVIDGLRWIVGCARPGQRVIVNLSDGSSRTLHDGSALVERTVAELVQATKSQPVPVDLTVVVAAGNSGDEERHAMLAAASAAPAMRRAVLRVAPDGESPAFVTLRLPSPAQQLRITAPGGAAVDAGAGESWGWTAAGDAAPAAGVVIAQPAGGGPAQGLLVIGVTRRVPGAEAAPAGDWCIERIDDDAAAQPVQLWVSRGQRNAGALPRSRQARFVDVDRSHDPQPQLRCLEVDLVPPGSAIRRAGSLNGIACLPQGQGMVVVGSALLRELRAPKYASSGPAAGPAAGARVGPDCAAAADFSTNQLGRLVHGNRSGVATRATGSSFAAPRRARQLAEVLPPALLAPPVPDPARLGDGIAPP